MRIVIENIEPKELYRLMEEHIKPSNLRFGNRDELIKNWDEYKEVVLKKGKEAGII
jgi:hypothetical protein